MIKNNQFKITILWVILVFIILFWNYNNYKKIAIRNLEAIEWELLDSYNYYVRNAQNIDYNEINQAVKHLDISINNYQDIRKTLIKANSEKIIDVIDRDFQKIASSNIVYEKNGEQFFEQINKLRVAIGVCQHRCRIFFFT